MNYATDRLDRRARHDDEDNTKSKNNQTLVELDLEKARDLLRDNPRSVTGHVLAANSCRDVGWCYPATFHYAMAWIYASSNDNDNHDNDTFVDMAVGDYAQMLDLAGYPELGVLALLYHRAGGHPSEQQQQQQHIVQPNINGANTGSFGYDCQKMMAYDSTLIGSCYFPISHDDELLQQIFQQWNVWYQTKFLQHLTKQTIPNANTVLEHIHKYQRQAKNCNITASFPKFPDLDFLNHHDDDDTTLDLVYFWKNNDNNTNIQTLSPVLQLLLLKLYYTSWSCSALFLPLACFAVPHLLVEDLQQILDNSNKRKEYKSHLAYHTLICAIVLGNRMKVHRQRQYKLQNKYHMPIWNVIFQHECRHEQYHSDTQQQQQQQQQQQHGMDISYVSNVVNYLQQLIQEQSIPHMRMDRRSVKTNIPLLLSWLRDPPLFVIGDSHVLSIGWHTICFGNSKQRRTLIPCPATGLKAWHLRPNTQFFTHANFRTHLQCIRYTQKMIIISAGEIDCREGMGGKTLQGYQQSCDRHVIHTVQQYIHSLSSLLRTTTNNNSNCRLERIFVMPVAPHAYRSEKNGKSEGRARRRERTELWNDTLHDIIQGTNDENIHYLDYEKHLRINDTKSPVGYVLNPLYNADFTHMNSAFLHLMEQAIGKSDYDFSQL